MNDSAFRHAKGEVNRLPCVFARTLREQVAVCEFSVRTGRTELPRCAQPLARATCGEFDGLLRKQSMFVLGRIDRNTKTSVHELKCIHGGGLVGLRDILDPQAPAPNVHQLLRLAIARFNELSQLPFAAIIQRIAAWKPTRRRA